MYKYLVNWGADPNVKDGLNNTPGVYLRNRELLTHKELLGGPAAAVSREGSRTRSRTSDRQAQPMASTSEVASRRPLLEDTATVAALASQAVAERWERPATPDGKIFNLF